MRRTAILLPASVASVVAVAAIATSGSAQSPGPTTLNIVDHSQNSVGFSPSHKKPRQGDRFGFGSKVTGDDTGVDRGICTVIGRTTAVCTVHVNLSRGILTAQGMINMTKPAKNSPFVVTGGSGDYNGARGTAFVTDVNDNTTNIQVTLLP